MSSRTRAINGLSRYREREADRWGLELVHGIVPNAGETAAQAFQRIAESGLSDPNPPEFIRWWLFDHPPVDERILFFRKYDPWSRGGEPRYVKGTTRGPNSPSAPMQKRAVAGWSV